MTSFRFTVVADAGLEEALARHAGASRFAYNQCVRAVRGGLDAKQPAAPGWCTPTVVEVAGVGLPWRRQLCAQVFEEAAVDLAPPAGGNKQEPNTAPTAAERTPEKGAGERPDRLFARL